MAQSFDRRTMLAAGGLALVFPAGGRAAAARKTLTLELVVRDFALRPGEPAIAAWRFASDSVPRFEQDDDVEVTIVNRLPAGVLLTWRGVLGGADIEPLLARGPIAPGETSRYRLTLRHSGTLVCDARLAGGALPLPLLPIVVSERSPVAADHDETLLIEDWHLGGDGRAFPPGADPAAAITILTVNGMAAFNFAVRRNERLRLRLINGAQRAAYAMKFDGLDVRIIAMDGRPAEPFTARDSRLVMAPGTRIDVMIDAVKAGSFPITLGDRTFATVIGQISVSADAVRPALPPPEKLSSIGLPAQLRLQSALRVDVRLDAATGWITPSAYKSAAPAFRVKRGRVVVLALVNSSEETAIFRLHGHPMRLLDRLDDGWKPFWLETVAVPGKQTVRLAFEATYSGGFLMEMSGTTWTTRTFIMSYVVDA